MKTLPTKKLLFRFMVILGLSLVYAGLLFFTYYKTHSSTAIGLCNFLFNIIIAWRWGQLAGVLMVVLNTVWTGIVLNYFGKGVDVGTFMGVSMQMAIAILTGMVGSLTRKLRSEIAFRLTAENKLKEYQNQLEEMVQKRTEELRTANERLRQAEKMEAIGQLAGGVAHDFNNQLTIIMGYCELLLNSLDKDSAQWSFVKQIDISGKRSGDLTRQLLAFARKGVYKSQIVDINKIASEVTSLVSRSVKNVEFSVGLRAEKPFIWGGPSQLQNAVLNLTLNARDAMENGGKLTIETKNMELGADAADIISDNKLSPGTYVCLSVKDTGTGISPDAMKHLFEPFFTTKGEGKGTGMGLAAVYGIVNSHKGGLKVETLPGQGSTFSLIFPVTEPTTQGLNTDTRLLKKKKINADVLVVDDEQDVAVMLKNMLVTMGCKVTVAFSGKEAVEIYKKQWKEINVTIIDMVMPRMNGSETFKALRQINPEIKTIIYSGYPQKNKIDLVVEDGAMIFLQKPFTMTELADRLQHILSGNTEGFLVTGN